MLIDFQNNPIIMGPSEELQNAEILAISKVVLIELELVMNMLLWFLNKATTLVWYWKEKKLSGIIILLSISSH